MWPSENLRKIENAQQCAYWKKNEQYKCVAMWKKLRNAKCAAMWLSEKFEKN